VEGSGEDTGGVIHSEELRIWKEISEIIIIINRGK
jgi:hypothetical protein